MLVFLISRLNFANLTWATAPQRFLNNANIFWEEKGVNIYICDVDKTLVTLSYEALKPKTGDFHIWRNLALSLVLSVDILANQNAVYQITPREMNRDAFRGLDSVHM